MACRRGNFAVLTAIVVPIMLVLMFGASGIALALATRHELGNIAETSCNRALKPTRMKIYTDSERASRALTMFDDLATERGIAVTSRTISVGWLSASITAEASIPLLPADLINAASLSVSITRDCAGVPPYPTKGEVILSSNFVKPDGDDIPMKEWACGKLAWGVYQAAEFAWDAGTGPGVEIQDWGSGCFGSLPAGSKSPYAVELDSHGGPNNTGNSSMSRILELHRGTYQFSFWYYGRVNDTATNRISVYLEGVRPVSAKVQKVTIAEPSSKGWIRATFEVPVSTYSIYRLTIAAEGKDDTYGGIFNDLNFTYIKRPSNLYND